MRARVLGLVAVLLVSAPLLAQEEAPPALTAAGWCALVSGEPGEGDLGCDVGVGAALWRSRRVFVAGVVGSRSAGFGVGWTAYRSGSVVIAVAAGVVAPYDSGGIRVDGWAPALGCTFGFDGGGR